MAKKQPLKDTSENPLRVFSDGSGTQSTAVMVLQAHGKLAMPFDAFVFANVGDDSENPETIAYRREYILPFAEAHGINVVERQNTRFGEPVTLLERILADNRQTPIPIVFPGKGYGNRTCTQDFKVIVVQRWIKEQAVSHAVIGLGFSREEQFRASKKYPDWHDRYMSKKAGMWKPGKKIGYMQRYTFPLIDLALGRDGCIKIVTDAGLPPPPKSACFFCPFTSRMEWIDRKRNKPDLFAKAIEVQDAVNEKYQRTRSDHPKASKFVSLHADGIDLRDVSDAPTMFDLWNDQDSSCETGYCGL